MAVFPVSEQFVLGGGSKETPKIRASVDERRVMNTETGVKIIIGTMLVGLIVGSVLVTGGCDRDRAPQGTAYFVVVKYKNTGLPYAAWASTVKPTCWTSGRQLYGYDNNEAEIFNEKLDTDAPGDYKTYSVRVLDIKKSGAFYTVYERVWRGKAPAQQFLDHVTQEDLTLFREKPVTLKSKSEPVVVAVEKEPEPEVVEAAPAPVKKQWKEAKVEVPTAQPVVVVKAPPVKHTYRVDWRRDEYFRYQAVVVRNDGLEIAKMNTRAEAERLLPHLK